MLDEVSIETLHGVTGGLHGDPAMGQTVVVFMLQQIESTLSTLLTTVTNGIDVLSKMVAASSRDTAASPPASQPMSLAPESLTMLQPAMPTAPGTSG